MDQKSYIENLKDKRYDELINNREQLNLQTKFFENSLRKRKTFLHNMLHKKFTNKLSMNHLLSEKDLSIPSLIFNQFQDSLDKFLIISKFLQEDLKEFNLQLNSFFIHRLRLISQNCDFEGFCNIQEKYHITQILINLFTSEEFQNVVLKNRLGEKILNEYLTIFINISSQNQDQDLNQKFTDLMFDYAFLEKINMFLNEYIDDIKISINFINLIGNLMIDSIDEKKHTLNAIFEFNILINKLFNVNIESKLYTRKIDYYNMLIFLLSNALHIYENEKNQILDDEFIIEKIFYILKLIIIEKKNRLSSEIDNKIDQKFIQNLNNYQENMIVEDNKFIQLEKIENELIENIINIISYFSRTHIEFLIQKGLKNILKLISTHINGNEELQNVMKIICNISKASTELLKSIIDEEFFDFTEQFLFYFEKFYENNHKKYRELSESEIKNFNNCLKYYFFYYSNILLIDKNIFEKIALNEKKRAFFKRIFDDYHLINQEVRYELSYIINNVFDVGGENIKSMIISENFHNFFFKLLQENYDNFNDTNRFKIIELCLNHFKEILKYSQKLNRKINFIKCEMEKENIPEIIHKLQNSDSILISEIAQELYNEYWMNDECFYDDNFII